MTIESLYLLAAAVFVFSLKPGAGIMSAIAYSFSHGVKGLGAFFIGFNIGLAIFLAIVFTGLMGINKLEIDVLFLVVLVKALASVYLIFIGTKELMAWDKGDDDGEVKVEEKQRHTDIIMSAIVLTISNPMIIVFYATIIPAFVAPETITLNVAFVIITMLMAIDTFGMVVYCAPVLLFRKKIPSAFMKYVKLASAIILIMIGLYIGYTAVPAQDITSVF